MVCLADLPGETSQIWEEQPDPLDQVWASLHGMCVCLGRGKINNGKRCEIHSQPVHARMADYSDSLAYFTTTLFSYCHTAGFIHNCVPWPCDIHRSY